MVLNHRPVRRALAVGLIFMVFILGCTVPVQKRKPMATGPLPSSPERTPKYLHDGWIIARASIHNHTTYSDGCRPADDLLELARAQGMAVLAYTDHREGKVCFGKSGYFCGERGGVEDSGGYQVYFDHLRRLQTRALSYDMIVLKGIEVSGPHFRNQGKFPHLVLMDGADHFIVYAIEATSVFEDMPVRDWVPLKPESEYHKEQAKQLVKYISDNGGIVHCAHPDWAPDDWVGPVHSMNIPPLDNVRFRHLTAFSGLPEGWLVVPRPGGQWDSVLAEYLAGMRERPLWISADADYHCQGSLAFANTMYYMREFTEAEVYRCMREGRMVALQGESFQDTYVAQWWVSDGGAPEREVMLGQEVVLGGTPQVRFSLNRPVSDCRTILVRNGVVVKEVEGTDLTYTDTEWGLRQEPAFYRIEVIGPRTDVQAGEGPTMPESELFVNPIFVRFRTDK